MSENIKNLQLLDNLACNSANKQSFQIPTKSPFAQRFMTIVQKSVCQIVKRWYINRVMDQNIRKLPISAVFAS